MKKILFVLIFAFAIFPAFAEEVTITTYYPAPTGVYKDLWAEKYYGYDQEEVPDISTVANPVYYGLDPVSLSGAIPAGSFLKQLYVGSSHGPIGGVGGAGGYPLDERVRLYAYQPETSTYDFNTALYAGTMGGRDYARAIVGEVCWRDSGSVYSTRSAGVVGENYSEPCPDPALYNPVTMGQSFGVYGATGTAAGGGVGIGAESQTDSGIALWAKASRDTSKGLIVEQGRVGIGTTDPGANVEIKGIPGYGSYQALLYLKDARTTQSAGAITMLSTTTDGEQYPFIWQIRHTDTYQPTGNSWHIEASSKQQSASGPFLGNFKIARKRDGAWQTDDLHIDFDTGNVGIGTTNPTAKLDVAGTANIQNWAEQSIGQNGYARMGSILIQWGERNTDGEGYYPVTFPIAFNNIYNVMVTKHKINTSDFNTWAEAANVTTTGFSIYINWDDGNWNMNESDSCYWMAIGN